MADGVIAEKVCLGCNELKPLTEFRIVNKSRKKPEGNHSARCHSCKRVYDAEWRSKQPPKPPKPVIVITEKACSACNLIKPIEEFPAVNRTKTKPQGNPSAKCDACLKDYKDQKRAEVVRRNKASPKPLQATKICAGCGDEKPLSEYHRAWSFSDGHVSKCRVCIKAYKDANKEDFYAKALEYRNANRELIREKKKRRRIEDPDRERRYARTTYLNNLDRILKAAKAYRSRPEVKAAKLEKEREWRKRNRERLDEYNRRRMAKYHAELKYDPRFVLNRRVRLGIAKSLRGKKDRRPWESLVGYTLDELISHLKKTMPKGYTWDDVLSGALHIDHRDPVSAFNFDSHTDIDFHRCWRLENLRLIPAFDNLSKGAKLIKPLQPSFKGV